MSTGEYCCLCDREIDFDEEFVEIKHSVYCMDCASICVISRKDDDEKDKTE